MHCVHKDLMGKAKNCTIAVPMALTKRKEDQQQVHMSVKCLPLMLYWTARVSETVRKKNGI